MPQIGHIPGAKGIAGDRVREALLGMAAGLAGLAGYVDAIGFIKLGGFFVSFMSGNSTRLAVGVATDHGAVALAACLLFAFVGGVVLGTLAAALAGRNRKAAVLALVTVVLLGAAVLDESLGARAAALALAVAMGAENAVFQRNGEVSIGLTYMTGTLVKIGQHLAAALMGGNRWTWIPYLLLWVSLTAGAVLGALSLARVGEWAIRIAACAAGLLAICAAKVGPVSVRAFRAPLA
ncbi:YoaK family protein [Sphingobium sp. CFD-2]|uniref:YoaK family protein n=1 Tax=Sphingobium sp. CFD-2 TaxID=2878542 RepID=UPI00214AB304|nr:DUF1275 family protein [Sphingobium sp. CFD-2]